MREEEDKPRTWKDALEFMYEIIKGYLYRFVSVMIGASIMALFMSIPLFTLWQLFYQDFGLPNLTYWQIWAVTAFTDLFIIDVK